MNKNSASQKTLFSRVVREFNTHKPLYLTLIALLLVATFLRLYRTSQILGFYFDQGRDALVVADLLQKGKFFLIGPTTGIAGIFRGPFYYYLIAPFYLLGGGNPVMPAVFLALTSVFALVLLYILGSQLYGRTAGLVAVCIATFSYYIVYASRWLSNPTPMLVLSLLLLLMMVLIQKGKQWAWVGLSFVSGSSLFHFGSSGEFFYFPALAIFVLWQWGIFGLKVKLPRPWVLIASLLVFGVTMAPLIMFDLRHEKILSHNILKFFGADQSFKLSFWEVATKRLTFVRNVFYQKVFLSENIGSQLLMLLALVSGAVNIKLLWKNNYFRSLCLLLIAPIIGLLFFQGNEGNIYDYYLTGYYLLFILFLAICLTSALKLKVIGAVFVFLFLITSFRQNILPTWTYINDPLTQDNAIGLLNQRKAINWVYTDAAGRAFNADTYVPPVIPYAYTYLYRWYESSGKGHGLTEEQLPLLYTMYEVDPPHPERLSAWMKRQEGIGKVEKEMSFGGITVQRRTRIEKK